MTDSETSPELVLAHLDSLPTLPPVAVRLLQVTADPSSAAADLIRLLRGDQSLTARILSRAGAAATGVRGPVTTLEKAVPLLGFAVVRNIVLATAVFECFGRAKAGGAAPAFDRVEFWKHALAVACAARRLARGAPRLGVDAEDAFVAGLLHDLGKVALDVLFPKTYERIAAQANQQRGDIADSERAALGADHVVAGRRLAERWRLPPDLGEAIWLHHLAPDVLPASVGNPRLIALVQLADTLAREQRIGYSGNYVFFESAASLAARLGLDAALLAQATDALAGDVAAHALELGLDGETAEDVYRKAITRANAELGRINAELAQKNRRLAAGDRYFKAVAHFERELADWADPSAVVTAAAHAAALVVQRPRVVAFGLRERAALVEIAWCGDSGDGHETQTAAPALVDWLTAAGTEARGAQPVPEAVRGLLAGRLAAESGALWLLVVPHADAALGGLVYASETDESARLAGEAEELRSFLVSLGLALGRANAQAAARRLSEDLAETNRRLQAAQAELLRSRALSMIAEMAEGAGHVLNTPLAVISGRAQMLLQRSDDPEARRWLQQVLERAEECSGVVTELLEFARPPVPRAAALDLAELLTAARDELLARRGLPAPQVRLEVAPAGVAGSDSARAAPLYADADQVRVVLRELLENAADALPGEGGRITIGARVDANAVEITVTDNGRGMSPAVLQKACVPFFSQQKAGWKRGLGLPRAQRIVEAHGGRVWLESAPGTGTTAHVLLPQAQPRTDASRP